MIQCELSVEPEGRRESKDFSNSTDLPVFIGNQQLAAAQRSDPSLGSCRELAVDLSTTPKIGVSYFWEGEVE